MKPLDEVAVENLRSLGLVQPRGGLDDQGDKWSAGSRDNLPETGIVEDAKIRF